MAWLPAFWKYGIDRWPKKLLPLENPSLNVTSDTFWAESAVSSNSPHLVRARCDTDTVQSHLPYFEIFPPMSFLEILQEAVLLLQKG